MNDWERHKKDLYHSPKNGNALIYVIIGTILLFFCKDGIPGILILWLWYALYCVKNNVNLNKNQDVLEARKISKKIEEKYKDK